ncbi:MAG: hypothetical protein GC161_12945 [Planctomycetaceae bacterium]|nr:hypothetical protein [Planctomycetaceae bacterium]
MNDRDGGSFALLGLGLVDAVGVCGTDRAPMEWPAGGDPLRIPGLHRRLFGFVDPTFRRLDRVSRALVIAAGAAGVGKRLSAEERRDTALVFETERGCLESDLEFAAGLEAGIVRGPLFPYTLPSTCLGELALRHGLRGPTYCLAPTGGPAAPQEIGRTALAEARAILAEHEARFALVACAEVLAAPRAGRPAALLAVVALIGPRAEGATADLGEQDVSLGELSRRHLRAPAPG